MPYVPQVWQDNVTPADAAHMNHMEAGIASAVEKPASIADGELPVWDAASGNWIRSGAHAVNVGDQLTITRAAGLRALGITRPGDANYRAQFNTDGALTFGDGIVADTNLYRSAASQLRTDGWLLTGGGVNVDMGNSGAGIYFGSAGDTNLYRAGANYLRTDDYFESGNAVSVVAPSADGSARYQLWVAGDTQLRWYVNSTGTLVWAQDTNLYRESAAVLRTDGSFIAGNGLTGHWTGGAWGFQTTLTPGVGIVFAGDTRLYRVAAAMLALGGGTQVDQNNYRLSVGGPMTGNGNMVLVLRDTNSAPTVNPADGVLLYADAGVLKVRQANGTVFTVGSGSSSAIPVGTSLPGSPVDGDEYILVDSTTAPTYSWHFRYSTGVSDANKWIFVGGSSLRVEEATVFTGTSANTNYDFTGGSITVPRAGVYEVDFGAMPTDTGSGDKRIVLLANGSEVQRITILGQLRAAFSSRKTITLSAASQIVKIAAQQNDGFQSNFTDGYIAIRPVRVA